MKTKHLAFACVLALAGCSPQGTDAGGKDAGADAPTVNAAAGAGGEERLYGEEKFSIVYRLSGQQEGAVTEYNRAWGRQRAEITDTVMRIAGRTMKTRTRAIYDGPNIATVNLDTGATTTTVNPMYDQLVGAMRGRTGVEMGKEMMVAMGGQATGERGTFAGQACEYWTVPSFGARSCVTPWGATVKQTTTFAGVTIDKEATAVRVGDGGPDEAFAYDASKATAGPDVEKAMKVLKGL